jgi:hypothetical protein
MPTFSDAASQTNNNVAVNDGQELVQQELDAQAQGLVDQGNPSDEIRTIERLQNQTMKDVSQ